MWGYEGAVVKHIFNLLSEIYITYGWTSKGLIFLAFEGGINYRSLKPKPPKSLKPYSEVKVYPVEKKENNPEILYCLRFKHLWNSYFIPKKVIFFKMVMAADWKRKDNQKTWLISNRIMLTNNHYCHVIWMGGY